MKKSIFERRIPTVFAFLILLGGIIVTSVLVRQGVFTVSQASPEDEPQNVQIVNTTNTSFTVAFTTAIPTTAGINIQSTNPPTLAYDKRDTSGKTATLTHFITVTSLAPDTTYSFSILSNGKNYLKNGELYTAKTSTIADSNSNTYPLVGSVLLPDGTPGADTLLTITIPKTQPIGAVTDPLGNYRISANNIRDLETGEIITLSPKTAIQITALQKDARSQVTYDYVAGETIPPVTLSNNYSFIASEEDTVSTDEASLLAIPTGAQRSTGLSIIVPKPNQTFIDARPQFRGTATPNTVVRLLITSEKNIEAQIKSDAQGNWAFRPNASIAPGTRTLTVSQSTPNTQRVASFQVFASGSQIAESATPSASIAPTKTLTPTPTTIVSPSAAPSISLPITPSTTTLTPTTPPVIIASIPATLIPTTPVVTVSIPQKSLPPTGDNTIAVVLTTLSVIFIVTGSAFLFML